MDLETDHSDSLSGDLLDTRFWYYEVSSSQRMLNQLLSCLKIEGFKKSSMKRLITYQHNWTVLYLLFVKTKASLKFRFEQNISLKKSIWL